MRYKTVIVDLGDMDETPFRESHLPDNSFPTLENVIFGVTASAAVLMRSGNSFKIVGSN